MKWRREALDASVREQLDLLPKERVLAWVDDGAGRLVVATETALHLQRVPPEYARFGWEQIERASYEVGVLSVTLTPDLAAVTLRVPVGDGRELPVVVRDRVTASIVVDRFMPLEGDTGVRIVGRRAADGSTTWRTDLDPALIGRTEFDDDVADALSEIQSEVGLA